MQLRLFKVKTLLNNAFKHNEAAGNNPKADESESGKLIT